MFVSVQKILTPFDYLRIKLALKYRYDYVMPFIMTFLFMMLYIMLPVKIALLGQFGLIVQVNSIIQVLIGFYIASLAAIATFKSDQLDELMHGDPPKLKIRNNKYELLSRRRFLCLLFSYLVTMCFILYCIGIFSHSISLNIKFYFPSYYEIIKYIAISMYIYLLSQLVITTFLGLHYIADKMHAKKIDEDKVISHIEINDD